MLTAQILFISSVLSILWGIYLIGTIKLYIDAKSRGERRVSDLVIAMRRFVVAFCAWLFVFSFVFRSLLVLVGVGDVLIGQILFFALLGANLTGSIFAIISLWYD